MKGRNVASGVILCAGVAAALMVRIKPGEVRLKPDTTTIGTSPIRVCADPNNLPFSNDRGEGFENKIAELLAKDLGTHVTYTWWAQRRGFVRNTLSAGSCDIVMGLPTGIGQAQTTKPYYRSTYVFVSQRARHLRLATLDDPRLRHLRIGVQMIGDDFNNSPPAHALSSRGIIRNVVGYSVVGDYRQPNPPARIVDAVAKGDVDAALVWGPLAGYFAQHESVPLEVAPISPAMDGPARPFVFDISMAVRRKDDARRRVLDEFIARRRGDIDAILAAFGVPRVDVTTPDAAAANLTTPDLKVGPTSRITRGRIGPDPMTPDLKVGPTYEPIAPPAVGPTFRSGAAARSGVAQKGRAL